ncbi:Extracellular ligand-binding receptor (plasmid) [Neorhizobium galegae bv. officinalis bv. officinalis str. HAMBI 1141]|uniref:Extracellular ligand-binding receptor n=1 Tax=Neorhizobium galegae bv. officinalis bv. officinalis str. HAMBI 1141 TaxID=1028801 RepID=A0A068THS0_NEOGA|nr:ABC transporter substrate-binding protein [Neorhizobium galegae]CDN57626.1 Extracellular ligand-binding receptor [Neorhizobium galegae bv. officinalis bv. officinalis str. HAMBI 1141]
MAIWFRVAIAAGMSVIISSAVMSEAFAEQLKLGVSLPLSGPASLAGTSIREGIEFAVKRANKNGGVFGQDVKIFIEDDEGNPTKGVTAIRKLIEQDGVVGISGTYVSAVAAAESKVAKEYRVPMISAGSTSSAVTDANTAGDPWFFRAFPGSNTQAKQTAVDTLTKLNAKTVAVLYENSIYGKSLADDFKANYQAAGGKVIAMEAYNPGDKDFYSSLTNIRAQSPSAVYIAGLMDSGAQIIRQAGELGVQTRIVGSGSMMSDKLIELAGPASEGFAVSSMFEPRTPNRHGAEFAKEFRAAYHKEPDVYSAIGFDSMGLLIEAARRVGKPDGAGIQQQLLNMRDFPLTQGPDGTTAKFDDKGSVEFLVGLAIVKNGKREWLPFN